jgi:hypothetical protein
MGRDESGRWSVTTTAEGRGLRTPEEILNYQGERPYTVDERGVSWPGMVRPDPPRRLPDDQNPP